MSNTNFDQSGSLKYQFGFNDKDTGDTITEVSTIATDIGVSPTSLSISFSPEFEAQAVDENGVTVSNVIGPRAGEFSMEGYSICETKLLANTFFWFDGRLFNVTNREISFDNQDFQRATLSGTTYSNVNHYCVGTLDATGNSNVGDPDLTAAATKVKGAAYLVTTGGTLDTSVISGGQAVETGDTVYYNGTIWVWEQNPCNA
tara:strand:- start:30 stop:635 length:606 start_codon:yes stop_codon:yes gene_type:complete